MHQRERRHTKTSLSSRSIKNTRRRFGVVAGLVWSLLAVADCGAIPIDFGSEHKRGGLTEGAGGTQTDSPDRDRIKITVPLLAPPASLSLGASVASNVLHIDLPLLRRVLLHPSDLEGAEYALKTSDGSPVTLEIHPMLRASTDGPLRAGFDYDATAIGRFTVDGHGATTPPETRAALALLVRKWLTGDTADHGAVLIAAANPGTAALVPVAENALALTLSCHSNSEAELFDDPLKPMAGIYTRVKDGHFYYGEQRLRLWGACRTDSSNLAVVERLHQVGFNAARVWGPKGLWDDKAVREGVPRQSKPGDGSPLDRFDRFYAELKSRGFFVWATSLHSDNPLQNNLPAMLDDRSFIAGGPDWPQWKAAMQEQIGKTEGNFRQGMLYTMLLYFDPRTQDVLRRHAAAFLNHVNPYTGKKYAEDEAIAVWEIENENAFVYRLLQGDFDSWPAFFRQELQAKWDAWLTRRYVDDAGLRKAWGNLAAEESLGVGSVQLGPTVAQRGKFPAARGNDFVHFTVDLVVDFNQGFHDFCRAQAPAGVGVNVAPFVADTQWIPCVPWLAADERSGDAMAIDTYQWALTSSLTAPPAMYMLDNHTVKGKPTLIYETNSFSTNPYRAEFPFRVLALAAQQDFDGVFFHDFEGLPNERNTSPTPGELYLAAPISYNSPDRPWNAAHFGTDPILSATIAIAGRIFLHADIPPAPAPAIYHVADDAVFSYRHFNGLNEREDTFTQGSRIDFTGEPMGDIQVERPPQPAKPSPVVYDFQRGRLTIDTPTAHVFVGATGGRYHFQDGTLVGDFSQPFVGFAMVSGDGKPLNGPDASRRIFLTAAANARNTGFNMDMSVARPGGEQVSPWGPQKTALHSPGRAPVIVDPVKFDLWFPTTMDYDLTGYDFALRTATRAKGIAQNEIKQDGSDTLFLACLQPRRRGATVSVPKAEEPAAPTPSASELAQGTKLSAADTQTVAGIWNPLPGVKWSDDFGTANMILRQGIFVRAGFSGPQEATTPDVSFVIDQAEILFDAPANIQVQYAKLRMSRIIVSFTQPPAFSQVVATYEKQFGAPAKKLIAGNAFDTGEVTWSVPQKNATLTITLTQVQGSMEISYSVAVKSGQ